MFCFDLSTIDDRDLADTIAALDFLVEYEAEQADNILFRHLLAVMSDEWHRRQGADIEVQTSIALPLADSTSSHVWALLVFASRVVRAAAQGEPSDMGCFFGCVINEIERAARAMRATVNN